MSRSKKGWLIVSALKAGEREQYMVRRSYGTVGVELEYAPNPELGFIEAPWLVTCWIDDRVTTYRSAHLEDARKNFKRLVRQHP